MVEVSLITPGSSPCIGFSGKIVSEWDAGENGDTISKIASKRMFDGIMSVWTQDLRTAVWMNYPVFNHISDRKKKKMKIYADLLLPLKMWLWHVQQPRFRDDTSLLHAHFLFLSLSVSFSLSGLSDSKCWSWVVKLLLCNYSAFL